MRALSVSVGVMVTFLTVMCTQSAALAEQGSAERAASDHLSRKLAASRYMSCNCNADPLRNWPGYEGRDVRRCPYSVTSGGKTLSAIVYLLNPTAVNIAVRIGNACSAVGLADHARCGERLARHIIGQSGGQFPVAGLVIERKVDAGGQGADPVYLEFRDGTTVVTEERLNFTDVQLDVAAMDRAAKAPVIATRRYARIASATRDDYRRSGGQEPVGASPAGDPKHLWPSVIRANELRAQDDGNDALLNAVAYRMRAALAAQ